MGEGCEMFKNSVSRAQKKETEDGSSLKVSVFGERKSLKLMPKSWIEASKAAVLNLPNATTL